jgi:transketolase
MHKKSILFLERQSREIRKTVLGMITSGNASHIGSSYSIVELLVYLYSSLLTINPKKPNDLNRDRFILSKGWGVSTLYAILAMKGFFPQKNLMSYCLDGSKFIGSATRNGIPGIEATTGSMGHGLPIGIGMAMAAKLKRKKYKVYVMISDGECDEGSTWEALLQAGNYKLDNLIVIIDYNKWQSFGKVKDILDLEPFAEKCRAFKCEVREINGHSFKDMQYAFRKIPFIKNKPSIIIAHTIKGKGVSVFENRNEWHYKTPRGTDLEIAKKELGL